eukprot:COSAG02_NODE_68438_length_244_cov_18844.710345_1_plen_24_part_01
MIESVALTPNYYDCRDDPTQGTSE